MVGHSTYPTDSAFPRRCSAPLARYEEKQLQTDFERLMTVLKIVQRDVAINGVEGSRSRGMRRNWQPAKAVISMCLVTLLRSWCKPDFNVACGLINLRSLWSWAATAFFRLFKKCMTRALMKLILSSYSTLKKMYVFIMT